MSRRAGTAVIFGGAGFIGCNWAHWLLQNTGCKVHVFDNLSRAGVKHNLNWLRKTAGSGRLQFTLGDIRDAEAVERAVAGAAEVYHLAAQVAVTTSVEDPRQDFEINLAGTINILEAARQSPLQPLVLFTSTNKVYGDMGGRPLVATSTRYRYREAFATSEEQPLDFHSPYGCSKGAADQYVRDYGRIYGMPTVVFRMSCVAGPRQFGNEDQGWVAHFTYAAAAGRPVVIYGDGRQVRDVLYVGDLLRAFAAARANLDDTAGQIYNLGGGEENAVSLLELAEEIEAATGSRLEFDLADMRPGDQLIYITDYSKFRRDTGWRPLTSVRQTVERVYEWWQQNAELIEGGDWRPAENSAAQVRVA